MHIKFIVYRGYVGSRKFVQDISAFSCLNIVHANMSRATGLPLCADPVYPNTLFTKIMNSISGAYGVIDSALALDQIGSATPAASNAGSYFYAHALNPSNSEVTATIANVAKSISGISFATVPVAGLPPTPLSSFMQQFSFLKDRSAVISGYGYKFKDPRYHTQYDNASHVSVADVLR
jgi:hypothetical protein